MANLPGKPDPFALRALAEERRRQELVRKAKANGVVFPPAPPPNYQETEPLDFQQEN